MRASTGCATLLVGIVAIVGACGRSDHQAAGGLYAAEQAESRVTRDRTAPRWPHEPSGFVPLTDHSWGQIVPAADRESGWRYLRRSSSKDDEILADPDAPFSPPDALRIVFTRDMKRDHEPSVHWVAVPKLKEIYTGWWTKLSPNWTCSPAGCGKITFLFTDVGGQVYTNYYHPSSDGSRRGAPYRIGANTEWAPYGQKIWLPNVATTWIDPGEWHRIEFYYRWETAPGISGDGIIRWWVNGVLNGDHRNVHYPAASVVEFQHASTRQNPPPTEQYMYIDHTYISAPAAQMRPR